MGLMYDQNKVHLKWWDRLFFPFLKNAQIFYFAGRGINEKVEPTQLLPSVEEAGKKPVLGTCKGNRVLIVEGIFDFLTADQEPECKSVMAILGNSPVFELPNYIKTVDLCFDWDSGGEQHIEKHGMYFIKQKKTVNVLTRPKDLPQGKKDLNDYIQIGGRVENLEKIDIADWYLEKLKTEPQNQDSKEKFFKTLIPKGEIERDKHITKLHKKIYKGLGVDKRSIKKEFLKFLKDEKKLNSPGSFIDEKSGKKLKLPDGYTFNGDRLISTEKGEIIAEKKIYISRLLKDITNGETYGEIVSFSNNEIISSIVPHSVISNKREIVKLSEKNFPVTSENAGKLTTFLYKFKYANEAILKPLNASSQLGWKGKNFLFPDRAINWKGEIESGYFIGNDPPKDAYTEKGDIKTYINFIRDMRDDLGGSKWVIPVFVIYATLASFILELLRSEVIIIHFTENTGSGKTSIMKLSASVFGKYDYHNLWNDTLTGLGRKAVKLKNFPLLINEGSIIEQKKGLAEFLYTLSEGQSREKATMDSSNDTTGIKRFFNVIISNGETSLLTGKEASGALIRVNEFFESFGGHNHKFIEKLEGTLKNNYGLLIEPFIKKVIELREGKGSVKIRTSDGKEAEIKSLDAFPSFEKMDTTDGPHSSNLNRKLKSLQPVYIAGCIAEDLFGFGYNPVEVVKFVFNMSRENIIENINRAERVMNGLRDFYQEHRSKFIDLGGMLPSDNNGHEEDAINEAGRTNRTFYGYRRECELMMIPEVFKKDFLKEFSGSDGKNATVILRELRDKGYIKVEGYRLQYMVRIGNSTVRMIYFPKFFEDSNEVGISEDIFSFANTQTCEI